MGYSSMDTWRMVKPVCTDSRREILHRGMGFRGTLTYKRTGSVKTSVKALTLIKAQ